MQSNNSSEQLALELVNSFPRLISTLIMITVLVIPISILLRNLGGGGL